MPNDTFFLWSVLLAVSPFLYVGGIIAVIYPYLEMLRYVRWGLAAVCFVLQLVSFSLIFQYPNNPYPGAFIGRNQYPGDWPLWLWLGATTGLVWLIHRGTLKHIWKPKLKASPEELLAAKIADIESRFTSPWGSRLWWLLNHRYNHENKTVEQIAEEFGVSREELLRMMKFVKWGPAWNDPAAKELEELPDERLYFLKSKEEQFLEAIWRDLSSFEQLRYFLLT